MTTSSPPVSSALLVDDDPDFRDSLALLVEREGYRVLQAASLAEAREQLEHAAPSIALVDLGLPDGNGLELISHDGTDSDVDFVMITGQATLDTALEALRAGASDYLEKPLDRMRLKAILQGSARAHRLRGEVSALRSELRELGRFGPLVGRSEPMQRVYDLISRVAPKRATVLVTGESGTGKELVAQTIHRLSPRQDGPLVAVNCGGIPETLIESELFGHEKGSFTGADRQKQGCFERASGGTLFLDEVTEMPVELQVNLLRVLETGRVTRVGGSEPIEVDVRVVAASNRDPLQAVRDGALREDLFYRLNVFPIELPPLRDRADDVPLLARAFLAALDESEGTERRLSDAAVSHLASLPWPGNVRELKNAVERASILGDQVIDVDVLPGVEPAIGSSEAATAEGAAPADAVAVPVGTSIAEMEKRLVLATLDAFDDDKKRAAEVLGISLKTLYNRLSVYRAAADDS